MRTHTRERLTEADEIRLAAAIEAGVLAEHLLASGERPVPATEDELAELVAEGRRCWQRFLLANYGLVWKLASLEAAHSRLGLDELFQEGFVAMTEALRRFDPRRGRFSVYAGIWIKQHLATVAAGRLGELGLPPGRAAHLRQVRGAAAGLGADLGRPASVEEVAALLDRRPEWTRQLIDYQAPIALGDTEVVAAGGDESEDRLLWAQACRRLDRLPPELSRVLSLRYGIRGRPLAVEEVAVRLRISARSVARMERRGLAELRLMLGDADADRLAG